MREAKPLRPDVGHPAGNFQSKKNGNAQTAILPLAEVDAGRSSQQTMVVDAYKLHVACDKKKLAPWCTRWDPSQMIACNLGPLKISQTKDGRRVADAHLLSRSSTAADDDGCVRLILHLVPDSGHHAGCAGSRLLRRLQQKIFKSRPSVFLHVEPHNLLAEVQLQRRWALGWPNQQVCRAVQFQLIPGMRLSRCRAHDLQWTRKGVSCWAQG